eukprot:Clim_evm26s240 gene=Clim_evmTU26s240
MSRNFSSSSNRRQRNEESFQVDRQDLEMDAALEILDVQSSRRSYASSRATVTSSRVKKIQDLSIQIQEKESELKRYHQQNNALRLNIEDLKATATERVPVPASRVSEDKGHGWESEHAAGSKGKLNDQRCEILTFPVYVSFKPS